MAGPLDLSIMGQVDVDICIIALVVELIVMLVDPRLVNIVDIFDCPNAIIEISDLRKVCISVLSS